MNRTHGSVCCGSQNYKPVFLIKPIIKASQIKRLSIFPVKCIFLFLSAPFIESGSWNHRPVVMDSILKHSFFQYRFHTGIENHTFFLPARISPGLAAKLSLESQLAELKEDNDAYESQVTSSVDLERIRKIAIGRLGMKYPSNQQTETYATEGGSYVRQYQDVTGK